LPACKHAGEQSAESGQTEIRTTYRFGPPSESGDADYPSEEGSFGDDFKKGSLS
jgi:hypothetical protein